MLVIETRDVPLLTGCRGEMLNKLVVRASEDLDKVQQITVILLRLSRFNFPVDGINAGSGNRFL